MEETKNTIKKPGLFKARISKKVVTNKLIKEYLEKRNNKVIIGNWKTNKKFNDIKSFANEFNGLLKKDKVLKKLNFIIGIAPTLVGLLPAKGLFNNRVSIVAQHVSPHLSGAYTGQVSYDQVHEYNVNYAIVGHSETRKYLNVSDTNCRDTIRTLLKNGMRPILCIGEDDKQYAAKKSKSVVMLQLMNCLKELSPEEVRQVIIAYEPIWAIGQKVASNDWIIEMSKYIRDSVKELFDEATAKEVHVLYGGAVKPENSKDILSIHDVDGVLIGGASLKANQFYEIICLTPEYIHINSLINMK